VTVAPLSAVVYRADGKLAVTKSAPGASIDVADETTSGRLQVAVDVKGASLNQVTFYQRPAGHGKWTLLGTDDNAPYRVFADVSALAPGTRLDFQAVVRDSTGRQSRATRTVPVPEPPAPVTTAVVHYERPSGDYDGWGLHLWGDAIAEGVGTDWAAPRPPDSVDASGANFRIPLKDGTLPVNFIVHTPSGDSVPTTREPGGDRSFVPADHDEIWLRAGDPAVYFSDPTP
jgi:hypothetical protein